MELSRLYTVHQTSSVFYNSEQLQFSKHITARPANQYQNKKHAMTDPDFLQVPPMRVVETERLRLRTVRVADAAAILPIITDATTMKYTSGLVANDVDVARRWLSARALGKDVLNFVIKLKDDDAGEGEQIVGIMGSYHWPEIGYLMHPGMFCGELQILLSVACLSLFGSWLHLRYLSLIHAMLI